jgi:hypothetical protein
MAKEEAEKILTKEEVEKKLIRLARKMKKIYLEYLDSLEEEGNEIGKEEGYFTVAIFRDSIHINSTTDDTELKEENQISWWTEE